MDRTYVVTCNESCAISSRKRLEHISGNMQHLKAIVSDMIMRAMSYAPTSTIEAVDTKVRRLCSHKSVALRKPVPP